MFRPAKIVFAGTKLSAKMWLQAFHKKVFMPDTKGFHKCASNTFFKLQQCISERMKPIYKMCLQAFAQNMPLPARILHYPKTERCKTSNF